MSSTAALTALQVAIPEGTAIAPAILVLLTSGLVGMSIKNMFDSILSDDAETEDGGENEIADGGGLMAEDDGSNDFGGLGGLDGDEGGDMDGFGDDEFGDMDDAGGGAATDELEHRLDELENEVGSLSSTVSTVRTENEQISESVQEVEENVRKLLDIYEMVTRGVNPFADDIEAGMGGGGMGSDSSFGLFDDGDGGQEEEDIDDDIANADAEGFFDEDLVEDTGGDEPAADSDVDDMFADQNDESGDEFEDDGGSFDENFDDGGLDGDSLDDGGDDDGEGGKSFQELKDEYESGDAEWADGERPDDAEPVAGDAAEDESDDADADDLAEDELFDDVIEDDGFDEVADDVEAETEPEPAPEPEQTAEPDPGPAPEPTAEPEPEPEPSATANGSQTPSPTPSAPSDPGKPYLVTLPSGFAGDLIVIEWLEYLLQQAGHREAARAIDYYETIDWIHEDVADDLQDILRGFDDVDGASGGLTIDHHTQSLEFISQLDDGGAQSVALSQLVGGGDAGGLQR